MSVATASTSETMWVERITIRSRKLGKQVAEPHAFFRVEAGGRLIHNKKLGIVQQGLGDAHALAHATGKSSQRPARGIDQIHQFEQLANALSRARRVQALDGGKVIEEFDRAQIGINSKVLRQIAKHGAQRVRSTLDVRPVPEHRPAVGRVMVARIRIRVDFPAPLGPSSPNTPGPTSKRKLRKASTFPR